MPDSYATVTPLLNKMDFEIQRLEQRLDTEGSWGSRIVRFFQNEWHRLNNIVGTQSFFTDSQIYTLLDKEVTNLSELIQQHEQAIGNKNPETQLQKLEENYILRTTIAGLTDSISHMMQKTLKSEKQAETKELSDLRKHLDELVKKNERELARDRVLLLDKEVTNLSAEIEKNETTIGPKSRETDRQKLEENYKLRKDMADRADVISQRMKQIFPGGADSELTHLRAHLDNFVKKNEREMVRDTFLMRDTKAKTTRKQRLPVNFEHVKPWDESEMKAKAKEFSLAAKKSAATELEKERVELKKTVPTLVQKFNLEVAQNRELMNSLGETHLKFLQSLAMSRGLSGSAIQIAMQAQKAVTIIQTVAENSKKPLPKEIVEGCDHLLDHVNAVVDFILANQEVKAEREAIIQSTRDEVKKSPAIKAAAVVVLMSVQETQAKVKQARAEIKNDLPVLADMVLKNQELMRFVTDSEAKLLQGVAKSQGFSGNNLQVALRGLEALAIIKRSLAPKQKLTGVEERELIKKIDPQVDFLLFLEERFRKEGLSKEVADLLVEVGGQRHHDTIAKIPLESLLQLGNSVIATFDAMAKKHEPISEEMQKKIKELKGHLKEFNQIEARRKEAQMQAIRKARKDMGKDLLEPVIKKGVAMQRKAKWEHMSVEQKKAEIKRRGAEAEKIRQQKQEELTQALLEAKQHHGRGLTKTLNTLAKLAPHTEGPRVVS